MDKKTENRLRSPEAAYRAKPFWSWNGELEEDELFRQMDAIKEMGFGGFFMHSRTGLITEYLGEKWMQLIRDCADRGAKMGLEAWLYDEDRWPSGTCGGLVTRNRDYRMRFISEYDSDEAALACPEVVGILGRFALRLEDGELCDAKPVAGAKEVPAGYVYAVYAEELFRPSDFYNGTTYVDTMNPEAVKVFLHSTLDRYAEECKKQLGGKIYGVFTDEPHRGALFNGFALTNANRARMVPYTGRLRAAYAEKYGEELSFPEIYYRKRGHADNETAAKYIDVLDDLFLDGYARQYGEWCREHGIIFTGHILHEDNLSIQTSVSGSMMRFYEYMDYPGIDNLSAHNGCFWAAIQCASVARQTGKKFVLSELYGCSGWDMPLNEYKRIGDWHALFGVNLRCPHLSWYTMKGEAKRDYPASILHQLAWYKDWKQLEDYYARIGIILTEGERRADLLVIHPVENMWKHVRRGWMRVDSFDPGDEAIAKLDADFIGQCMRLIASQHEFDYGDEELLAKYGSAGKDGQGAYLTVGQITYRRVLLAPGQAVRPSTQKLLDEFIACGGQVLREPEELSAGEVARAPKNIASAVRRFGGDVWLFLYNVSETEPTRGCVELAPELAGMSAEEWDMVSFESRGACALDDVSFAAGEMRIFRLSQKKLPAPAARDWEKVSLPEKMPYTLSEPNVLVLDYAKLYYNGELQTEKPADVLLADRNLRIKLGLTPRGGEMVQPWYAAKYGKSDDVLGKVRLEYRFDSEIECSALVAAEYDGVACNGVPAAREEGHWVDSCFRLFRVQVKKGENVITAEFDFKQSDNIESMYLLGEFGVRLPHTLVPLPETLSPVDLNAQGLPYYGACVTFRTGIEGGRVRVALKELHGATFHVSDGKADKMIAFPPYEAEAELDGELQLTVCFTRRNTFGPHHLIPQPQDSYGPGSWLSEGVNRTDDYVIIPQGFIAEVRCAKK